ncbi:MAG TPA: HD-GYP domain-containing protein [Actinomycetota bacterium]|jgi:putative nucleotidyltransferase with HDIG domain
MATQNRYISVKPYFPHALVATAGVVLAPIAVIIATVALARTAPSVLTLVFLALGVALVAAVVGSALWRRRPESADIGFDQLMLWAWLHRRNAEDRLEKGASLLGLDRAGTPIADVQISRERQLAVLHDLNAALESKDPYTHGHSQRVERHSYRTAFAMGLSVHDIEDLRRGAALHDVGKIRIPDRILRKPTQLTIEERAVVEEHVVVGAWMVSQVGNSDVVSAVRHHHERWDGAGYPDGLAGSDIPLFARIIAVADAYDAITSTRPYRVSSDREFAVDVLRESSGTQFDPQVVDAFIAALPLRTPVAGLMVLLAGPRLVFKEISLWLRKLGAGNLTPAVGAVGAAVMLSSFVAAPAFTPDDPIRMRPAPQVQGADQNSSLVAAGPKATTPRTPEKAKPARGKPAKDARARDDRRKRGPLTQVLGSRITRRGNNGPADGGGGGNDGNDNGGTGGGSGPPQGTPPTDGGGSEAPPAPAPSEEPTPEPSSPPADEGDKDHTDPQPDHGRDCDDHPGSGGGGGNEKHCDL